MSQFPHNASTSPELSQRKTFWLRFSPFLILLLAAAVLWLKWDSLPERWVVDWGAGGVPNGWATRTPFSVFLPLLAGGFVCLLLEVLATAIIKHPRVGKGINASPEAAAKMAAVTGEMVRMIAVGMALLFAILAVALPLLTPQSPGLVIASALALTLIPASIGIVRLKRTAHELKSRGLIKDLEGWNGIIYRNPSDPRLIVPRPFTHGYTFNFANPWAWPILILLIAIPPLVVLVVAKLL